MRSFGLDEAASRPMCERAAPSPNAASPLGEASFDFYRLLEGAVAADPHSYKALTSKSAA
jgi:hypothetical protein